MKTGKNIRPDSIFFTIESPLFSPGLIFYTVAFMIRAAAPGGTTRVARGGVACCGPGRHTATRSGRRTTPVGRFRLFVIMTS